ncbi:hypothetical protein D3C75_269960 [compost metagenome]|nr:hypothetical protein R70331_09730 [Paenibacillus sp. FSL R7-0331]
MPPAGPVLIMVWIIAWNKWPYNTIVQTIALFFTSSSLIPDSKKQFQPANPRFLLKMKRILDILHELLAVISSKSE